MDWSAGWNKRIKLTISGSCIEGDLSDFPVMVHLDSTCSGVFNELGSNSKRISVVAPDQSQCYVEVESWNETTKNAWLWVKIPSLSSGASSNVYLYYDNLHPDNSVYVGVVGETSAQNVWDDYFVGVWHMNQDPTGGAGCIKDSTSNINHGTPGGSMTSGDLIDGKIGKALDFDGNDDKLSIPHTSVLQPTIAITLECVTKPGISNNVDWARFISKWDTTDSQYLLRLNNAASPLAQFYIEDSTGATHSADSTTTISSITTWYYLAAYFDGNYLKLFVNTTEEGSTGYTGTMDTSPNTALGIGAKAADSSTPYNGDIDEVRISNTARSAPWIKATYYSNWNQLLTYGAEETVSSGILPGWNNRLKLTIQNDHIDNTLTDFPVMIKLSEDSGFNSYDNRSVFYELETNINRKKIAITDSMGIAQCFVEIERFSCEETEAVLWTRLPIIYDSIGTHFYLYYDKSQADNNLFVGDVNSIVAQNVWDDSFVGVWHMNQDPTGGAGCIKDSTSNSNHGTPGGAMASGDLVDGKVGKALDFDGSDDYVTVVDNSILDLSSQMTLECIIKLDLDQTGTVRQVIAKDNSYNLNFDHASTDFKGVIGFKDTTSGWNHGGGPVTISKDEYYNFVGTYGGTYLKTYLNGIEKASNNVGTKTIDNSTGDLYFGSHNTSLSDGISDEIRISKTARSAPWIKATYHSNWDSLVIFEKEDISATWLDDWTKRIKLTIDHTKIDSSLIDFPVLVTLTSGVQSGFFDEMSYSDRKKIAVTKNNGTTQCPVEIEQFDVASGVVNLWTKIPTVVFDIDTDLYLYYDSSKDDNDFYIGDVGSTPAQNVWDDNFVGVWHMSQDPTGGADCIKDSTSNTNHGTPVGSMASGDLVDGKIGKALDFDGINDHIDKSDDSDFDFIGAFTLETVVKPNSANIQHRYVNKYDISSADGYNLGAYYPSTPYRHFFTVYVGGNATTIYSNNSIDIVNYTHVVGTRNTSGNVQMLINGSVQSDTNTLVGAIDSSGDLRLGIDYSDSFPLNGIEDEVRISNIARSDAWIKATYHSNWNTLLTQSSAQDYTPPPDYYYHGYVKEEGIYVSRKLYLYRRDTGLLIDSCMSNAGTGYYLLETFVSGEHFVVALDDDAGDDYNALIQDRIYPNDM